MSEIEILIRIRLSVHFSDLESLDGPISEYDRYHSCLAIIKEYLIVAKIYNIRFDNKECDILNEKIEQLRNK